LGRKKSCCREDNSAHALFAPSSALPRRRRRSASGANVARHPNPGIESAYLLENGLELSGEGFAGEDITSGEGIQITTQVPHGARNGHESTKPIITYVVHKDKPLTSPALE
jgi:hypothetical protein